MPNKKTIKKKVSKNSSKNAKSKKDKPVGEVKHFFGKIKVAVIKFKVPTKIGSEVWFKGATTDFRQKIDSIQFDHKPIKEAKKGKEVGVKVKKQVREGDLVLKAPK